MLEYLMATDPGQSGELVIQAHGDVASTLLACNMDYRALRPYVAEDNKTYITQVHNGVAQAVPVGNVATLTHEDWRLIDRAVEGVKRERLTF